MFTYRTPWIIKPGKDQEAVELLVEWVEENRPAGSGPIVRIYEPEFSPSLIVYEESWLTVETHDAAWQATPARSGKYDRPDLIDHNTGTELWRMTETKRSAPLPESGGYGYRTVWQPKDGMETQAVELGLDWSRGAWAKYSPEGLCTSRWYGPRYSPNFVVYEGVWQSPEQHDTFWGTFGPAEENIERWRTWYEMMERRVSNYRWRVHERR